MSQTRVRTSIVGVVALALFCALVARAWYLQVAAGDSLQAAATENTVRIVREPAMRGRILDADGNVLAENRVSNVITVDRKLEGATRRKVIARLALLLEVSPETLRKRLDDPRISPYAPVPVADDVPYDKLAYVSEHLPDFPGVRAESVPVRSYPNNALAFHLLGYTGEINEDELRQQLEQGTYELGDKIGKTGVEQSYESDLRGTPGITRLEVDSTGKVLRRVRERAPKPGKDIRLTLRLDTQQVAETALAQGLAAARRAKDTVYKRGFRTLNAPAGAVVVLDTTNGSVVAYASAPSFDANKFVNGISTGDWTYLNDPASDKPLFDRVVSGQYLPGSTFKLVTAVAGLDSKVMTANTTIDDTGKYAYPSDPDHPFTGEGANGRVALARALTVSSDVYFYTIGGDLYYRWKHDQPGGNTIQEVAREFGFGSATGISMPNEAVGRVPDAEWKQSVHDANPEAFPDWEWLPGDNIQTAIGQKDVLVTPIQMASAYATFANGGTRFSPRLADAVYDRGGKKLRDLPPIVLSKVDIPDRDTMLAGFRGVVEDPKGTAARAFAGFPAGLAAGKTGTAQVQDKQNTSWFVGMTPADAPRYVVLAVVEEGGYGAQTAAPIVRAVMEQLNQLPVGEVTNVAPPTGN